MIQGPPFFIVGCGRSGTTLLRTALNQHSQIAIPLESLFIVDYLRVSNKASLSYLKRRIAREYELGEWGISVSPDDFRGCSTIGETVARLHLIYAGPTKNRWGQKTPRFVRHHKLLLEHFPDALFVHMIRDPRAVAASLKKSPVHVMPVRSGALRWRNDVLCGLQLEQSHAGKVIRVIYEDLVTEFHGQLKRVCDFLGLPFEDKISQISPRELAAFSNPYYREIHSELWEPVTAERAQMWRSTLSQNEIATVEEICRDLMRELGYAPIGCGTSVPQWRMQAEATIGFVKRLKHYLMFRTGYLPCVLGRKIRLLLTVIFSGLR